MPAFASAPAPAATAEQALGSNDARLEKDAAAPSAGISARARGAAQSAAATVHAAVASGDVVSVKALLDQGAAVDETDDNGTTPLLLATAQGRTDIVRLLLERGADPNAADQSGRTALGEAKRRRLKEIEILLVQAGAR